MRTERQLYGAFDVKFSLVASHHKGILQHDVEQDQYKGRPPGRSRLCFRTDNLQKDLSYVCSQISTGIVYLAQHDSGIDRFFQLAKNSRVLYC